MHYLIGLDIGTSSVKGALVSENGADKVTGRAEFSYVRREDGGVELDPEAYVEACASLLRRLAGAVPQNGRLLAVCAASASGNLLVLDERGRPSTPIFGWQDSRTGDEADRVLRGIDRDTLYRRTGWPFDGKTFPLAVLCRLKCRRPAVLERAGMVCMSTEYLYYRLTGRWGISGSAGTPFYLIDQRTGRYCPELLAALGLREAQLPPVGRAGTVLGPVTAAGAALSSLPAGTPVVLGTFDHPSAARGAGVLNEGQLLLSCGTSWGGFYPIRDRERALAAGMLADPFLSPQGGCWGGMVSLPSLSARIEGYVRRYIAATGPVFETFAACAARGFEEPAGGLVIRPTEEPDDEAIGRYAKPQIARAIMEGTAALLRDRLGELKAHGIAASSAVMVGGPTENPLWARLIGDMTGLTVQVVHGAYAGAVGAAMTAGIAAQVYEDEAAAFAALSGSEREDDRCSS